MGNNLKNNNYKSKMKLINMAIAITLFATSYANEFENESEDQVVPVESVTTSWVKKSVEVKNEPDQHWNYNRRLDAVLDAVEEVEEVESESTRTIADAVESI